MDTETHADLAELLDRAGATQAALARLAGVSARHVNSWCCGRAAAPRWALVLAALLAERSPEELALMLDAALAAVATVAAPPPNARTEHRPPAVDAPDEPTTGGP